MSARSIARNHTREQEREARRRASRARRATIGAATALGAGLAFAPSAGAAILTVDDTGDGPAGPCTPGTCTIRDAVDEANNDPALDTIRFAPGISGSISLALATPLPIETQVTIEGPGAGTLAIDGNDISQLITVDTDAGGSPNQPVTISGLTLRDGATTEGAAIYSTYSDLRLDRVVVSSNEATGNAAVYSETGSLTVTNSSFTGNTAAQGAAIYTDDDNDPSPAPSRLVVRNSTFTGNSVTGNAGAIYVDDETDSAVLDGVTIAGNTAAGQAGGILFYGTEEEQPVLRNSTVSGNASATTGGGVYVYSQYDKGLRVENSTIAGNLATRGGGIYRLGKDDPALPGLDDVVLSSTIVGTNTATTAGPDLADDKTPPDLATGSFQVGLSLIGTTTGGATITQTAANKLNVAPQIGPLADNGGPTETRLPQPGSPALDSGISNGLTTDQRGLGRTVKLGFTPGLQGSDFTDIGAVEVQDDAIGGASIKAKKSQRVGKKLVVKVKAGAAEEVDAVAKGSVKAKKAKAKLKVVKKRVAAGKRVTLKLVPTKKKAGKKVIAAIKDGAKGKAELTVTLTDAAGNEVTKKPKVKLKG